MLDLKVDSVDDNHFIISVMTDSQMVFNVLIDKDYPTTRSRRIGMRKYNKSVGKHLAVYKEITAAKV